MDMNGHINNVTYLAWALETVPEAAYSNQRLYEVGGWAGACAGGGCMRRGWVEGSMQGLFACVQGAGDVVGHSCQQLFQQPCVET